MKIGFISKVFSDIFKDKGKMTVMKDLDKPKFLDFSVGSFDYYQRFVKGNEDISLDQARRKITRNMLLSAAYKRDSPNKESPRTWYAYGILHFIVKDNTVTWIQNHQPIVKGWKLDYDEYKRLSERFGIDEAHIK